MATPPTEGQMATGVVRRTHDRGGVSSKELSTIMDRLTDMSRQSGPPQVKQLTRPSGAAFAVAASWDNSSAFQLTVPQDVDTSDRTLVHRAHRPSNAAFRSAAWPPDIGEKGGFDAEGFDDSRGLMRTMYYWSPFMTCAACNTLAVFDSASARAFQAVLEKRVHDDAAAATEPEPLPRCGTCGSTADWTDGAHNLLTLLGANRAELAERLAQEKAASLALQAAYRRYLMRRWGRAEVQRQIVLGLYRYRAACLIQTLLRGRLGRRRAVTWCAVQICRKAHSKLLALAVKGEKHHKRRVFWYTKAQLPMVYEDYLEVTKRTGFDPPRLVVEENLHEIARRVRVKEGFYAGLIQKLFRGMQARRFLLVFLKELVRVRDIRSAAAYRVQRLFRGWVGRRVCEQLMVARFKSKLHVDHLKGRRDFKEKRLTEGLKEELMRRYAKERAEERSARLTGLVNPGACGGKKMAAFHASSYGSDAVTQLMVDVAKEIHTVKSRKLAEENKYLERAEFVHEQQAKGRPMEIYFAEEMRQRSENLIERLAVGGEMPKRHTHSILKKFNGDRRSSGRKGTSYKYPEHLYVEPSHALFEGTGVDPPDLRAAAEARRAKRLEAQAEVRAAEQRAAARKAKRRDTFAASLDAARAQNSQNFAAAAEHKMDSLEVALAEFRTQHDLG